MTPEKGQITAHVLIKNEERFVEPAIRAALPLVSRVLVYDTGSTDRTLEIVSGIRSDKIELVQKSGSSRRELTRYRNEMRERTETEWYMLIDGDEIYPATAVERLRQEIAKVPPSVDRLVVWRRHFVDSVNYISRLGTIGRIYRTSRVSFYLKDDWFQTPCLVGKPSVEFNHIGSLLLPPEIFFFHFQYCRRSSKDEELGNRRAWRRAPFPVFPYFGPWPEGVDLSGTVNRITPGFLAEWAGKNGRILHRVMSQMARKVVHRVLGAPPVPGGIQ